jgi:hypothetical protein
MDTKVIIYTDGLYQAAQEEINHQEAEKGDDKK